MMCSCQCVSRGQYSQCCTEDLGVEVAADCEGGEGVGERGEGGREREGERGTEGVRE